MCIYIYVYVAGMYYIYICSRVKHNKIISKKPEAENYVRKILCGWYTGTMSFRRN